MVASAQRAIATATAPRATALPRPRRVTLDGTEREIKEAITRAGKPPCQNIHIQTAVCGPAPSKPVGEKIPGNTTN